MAVSGLVKDLAWKESGGMDGLMMLAKLFFLLKVRKVVD